MRFVRLHIIFLLLLFIISGCGVIVRALSGAEKSVSGALSSRYGRSGEITEVELGWAKTAWTYFNNNYNPSTGLINSSDNYPNSTLKTMADNLIAISAAYELKIITKHEFDLRLSAQISFLNKMQLLKNKLPNKYYNTKDGKIVNSANEYKETGTSGSDIGRLLIVLKIIRQNYPNYSEYIDKSVLRWNFCNLIDNNGFIFSSYKTKDSLIYIREGNLGEKEYFARGYQAWGFDTDSSSVFEPFDKIKINNIILYFDGKDERKTNSINALTSMPYLLDGIEFNWRPVGNKNDPDYIFIDERYAKQAENVYKVQESRYIKDKIFTAKTNHKVLGEPYFVYDAIFANGYPWNTISDVNKFYPQKALVSVQAVFGMWVLFRTDYTNKLIELMNTCFNPYKGWYEGREEQTGNIEKTLTSSTNAFVLECLWFKKSGMIYNNSNNDDTFYNEYLSNMFNNMNKCFPKKRKFGNKY